MTGGADTLDAYRGLPVAVLGASGFIGRWVTRRLCELDAEVYLVVRDLAQAAAVFGAYGIGGPLIPADATDLPALQDRLCEIQPAMVFNLIGYGVDRVEKGADMARQVNVNLVAALCDALDRWEAPGWAGQRLVHAGSVAEYGQAGGDFREDGPTQPVALYGQTKLAGTLCLAERCAARGLRGVAGRLFMVYGPGEHAGRLLPALLRSARTGEPVRLSSGEQQRDFTYVEDAVEGLLRLGLAQAAPGEIVNVATGRVSTVREFAEQAAAVLGIPAKHLCFGALPTRPDEVRHEPVNLGKLHRLTGWLPTTSIADGVRKTLAHERLWANG